MANKPSIDTTPIAVAILVAAFPDKEPGEIISKFSQVLKEYRRARRDGDLRLAEEP